MIYRTIIMKTEGSMPYARLTTYFHERSGEMFNNPRKTVLICPGGAYAFTSEREGEPVAMELYNHGFNAAVLWYSVSPATYPTALKEAGQAMQYLYNQASKVGSIDRDKLIIMGFSAGGHLAASYASVWKEMGFVKPAALALCYPVITSGEFAHRESFDHLLGEADAENKQKLEEVSMEKHVGEDNPPTFIWTTYEDDAVPVENSLLYLNALRRNKIQTEFHMFAKGQHGLSLADQRTQHPEEPGSVQAECTPWINLLLTWMDGI